MDVVDLIKQDEGLRLHVYDDATGEPIVAGSVVEGNPTIGYGRLLTESAGLTEREVEQLFSNDLNRIWVGVAERFGGFLILSKVRQAVLMSMAYNMGISGLMGFQSMLRAIERKNWDDAAAEIMDSNAARRLPERYKRLAEMMRSDKWPDEAEG